MRKDDISILKDLTVEIPDRRIFHRLGYKSKTDQVDDRIRAMVDTQRGTLQTLMEPAALYRILEYHQTNLHPIFEGASHVALCICTIGAGVERAAQDLTQNGELLKGFILDSLGSEAAEEVARLSNDVVAMRARAMGLRSGKRFSPGYGIWDLREQAWIFEVLPAQRVGVTLTDDFLMLPRKSVSYRVNFN